VPLDPPSIGGERRRLFGLAPLAENKAILGIGEVSLAQLSHSDGVAVDYPFLSRVFSFGNASEERARFSSRFLRRPDAMRANGHAAGPSCGAILDQIAALP
jgi:hypothetical protein